MSTHFFLILYVFNTIFVRLMSKKLKYLKAELFFGTFICWFLLQFSPLGLVA